MEKIRYGVLTFGYETSVHFRTTFEKRGFYSVNLGDNAQSIAIRHILRQLGCPQNDVIDVNRDTLSGYSGPPVALIMNGVFPSASFPLPPQVTPVFVGFHAKQPVIRAQAELLARHQPIGCRDNATTGYVRALGIAAETTGCLTMALPARTKEPDHGKIFIVHGGWSGLLPSSVIPAMP